MPSRRDRSKPFYVGMVNSVGLQSAPWVQARLGNLASGEGGITEAKLESLISERHLPRRLIRRLRLGIEPINTAHRRRGAFDNLRFEVMYKVEHRLNKRTTTETD